MSWPWLKASIQIVVWILCIISFVAGDARTEKDANATSTEHLVSSSEPITVAVIGCGPSGMFFLHALAETRKKLIEANDTERLRRLPHVTVYERSSSPGGVWKSDRNNNNNNNNATENYTNMYEGLWINGHKEGIEFFDYTFEEHFQEPQSVFLPRQRVLEYMMARVAKYGDIFNNTVQFDTTVQWVEYDDAIHKFEITTQTKSGSTGVQHFDKCIWAGGMNGAPNMVPELLDLLVDYKGQIVHSSGMANLLSPDTNAVRGQRILLIGDGSSAEDLALQTIKLGAEKIYVSSRSSEGSVSYTTSWPMDRVENFRNAQVSGVKVDGTGKTIMFQRSYGYEDMEDNLDPLHDAEDIDIIIFCTGYLPNYDFLDEELWPWPRQESTWKMEDFGINSSEWKMKDNVMGNIVGDVIPADNLLANTDYLSEVTYRRKLLMENTDMMFLYEVSPYPLLELDIAARTLLLYITGEKPIPSVEEMTESNRRELLESMQESHIRYIMDRNYREAVTSSAVWTRDEGQVTALVKGEIVEACDCMTRFLARDMNDGNYPLQLGDFYALDETGLKLSRMMVAGGFARVDLWESDDETKEWKTLRDLDPTPFTSLFTGMGSVPLKGKWIEVDNDGNAATC